MAGIQEVYDLVVKGKAKVIAGAVQEALDAGCDPTEVLNKGMIAAMDEVGAKFKNGEIFVPEMLVAARAMKKGECHSDGHDYCMYLKTFYPWDFSVQIGRASCRERV